MCLTIRLRREANPVRKAVATLAAVADIILTLRADLVPLVAGAGAPVAVHVEGDRAPSATGKSFAAREGVGGDLSLKEHGISGDDVGGVEDANVLEVGHGSGKVGGIENVRVVELHGGSGLDGVVLVHELNGLVGVALVGGAVALPFGVAPGG